jgi:putative oxidoreductase
MEPHVFTDACSNSARRPTRYLRNVPAIADLNVHPASSTFDFIEHYDQIYSSFPLCCMMASFLLSTAPFTNRALSERFNTMSNSAAVPHTHTQSRSAFALADAAPLAGRVFLSAIFVISGASKIAAPAATIGYIESAGLPLAPLGFALAVIVEILGGLALIAGYRTQLVAAGLAGFTLATALAYHGNLADQNQFIHFFKNIAMAGGLLQVVAFGAGRFSLDARR